MDRDDFKLNFEGYIEDGFTRIDINLKDKSVVSIDFINYVWFFDRSHFLITDGRTEIKINYEAIENATI